VDLAKAGDRAVDDGEVIGDAQFFEPSRGRGAGPDPGMGAGGIS
jgi:hypothetical protein